MKLLHVDSAITGEGSISRKLTSDIVARLRRSGTVSDVAHLDLATAPLSHFTLSDAPAAGESTPVLEAFLASDIVVIGAPMYNFNVASQLKAWIDRILVAGKTFRYETTGPIGLAGDKRVIIAVARGGFYGAASPTAEAEHVETYLRTVFGFIGITPEFIVAEGILVGPDHREAAIQTAEQAITALAA